MKKLYKLDVYYGKMGDVKGLFIAEEKDVKKLIGKEIYFGEILGKYSEVYFTLEKKHIEIKSVDQNLIKKLEDVFKHQTLSGYNPFDYVDDEEM